jgi:demethylmenaquinone methyltransferase / 2-methoxy-6-polyprenyl-1,4-benzoquinol methylase
VVSSEQGFGLKEDWDSVQKTLEEIIPIYDKTNRYISLGTDLKLRRRGIELLRAEFEDRKFSLLDLGCGTGTMTKLFLDKDPKSAQITLVDPISNMMKVATRRVGSSGILAVYEFLPFQGGAIDAAMAGFSLRDARNLISALKEIRRLLSLNGKFLIVDLSKPDSSVRRWMISIYWGAIAPLIAFLSSGRLGLKFGALSKTYKRLPTISEFFRVVEKEGFKISRSEFRMLGGAAVILLSKSE